MYHVPWPCEYWKTFHQSSKQVTKSVKTKPYLELFFYCISLSLLENICMIIRIIGTRVLHTQRSWLEFPFIAGSWKMDFFEDNSTVLPEYESLHFWYIYHPINVLCWLNQHNKNGGSTKTTTLASWRQMLVTY